MNRPLRPVQYRALRRKPLASSLASSAQGVQPGQTMEQPCISCGRDTKPGTRLFSARKRGIDTHTGEKGYLCQACQQGSATLHRDQNFPVSARYAVIDFPGGFPG